MKTKKMSLANIQGKLSRTEMKNIMAGIDATKCGSNISCADHTEFQACGSSGNCGCGYVPNGGNVLYCRMDS